MHYYYYHFIIDGYFCCSSRFVFLTVIPFIVISGDAFSASEGEHIQVSAIQMACYIDGFVRP